MFASKAKYPTAVLLDAVVLLVNADLPQAVLFAPVVFNTKELYPIEVFAFALYY